MTSLAGVLQLLLAATFVIVPVIAYRHGTQAQQAAEADVARQGFPIEVLTRHRIRFAESAMETLFPFGIALFLAVLALLNLTGTETGRVLSLVAQPIMFIGGGFITAGQMFPVRFIGAALKKSSDATARTLDVQSFVDAATAAFPSWLRPIIVTRFALVTVGSLLVIALLALR
ncbi:hypothetical protein LWC34_17310 [Kibdelosporangium philippinense]|uniref:DUF1772 domain-containing protein n=1 Tax=Kibdelosporangium philippinense TaxID=211113 RepID=A0ABS8ZFF6_9PSEU|nr:hypothetical protein [Kibdelosporangium philippinense]MCE7004572.1 hypothetical protein [Kibdelosporangium philippinense]